MRNHDIKWKVGMFLKVLSEYDDKGLLIKNQSFSNSNNNQIQVEISNDNNDKDIKKEDEGTINTKLVWPNTQKTGFSLTNTSEDRLDKVKGIDEVKDEITEVVNMLQNPKTYEDAGAKLIRGILLVGKPGTGKTLLARSLAGESNVKFIHCNGSEFDQVFVGQGTKIIKELFNFAREHQPCIIFIDEIDSLLHKSKRSG